MSVPYVFPVCLFVLHQFLGLYLTTPYLKLCNVDDKLVRE